MPLASYLRERRRRAHGRALRALATVGRDFVFTGQTRIHLRGAERDQVRIGDYVSLGAADLICYERGALAIGDFCWFGDRLKINSFTSVEIGPYSIFAQDVYISDTNEHPTNALVRREQTIALLRDGKMPDRSAASSAPIRIGQDVWIGERACVLKGVTLGDGAIVGANAVVVSDVPAGGVAVGNPARVVKRV